MAHPRQVAVADNLAAADAARLCETCGRRLKPVYPNLVSLGARRVFFQMKLECPAGCESWVYEPDLDAWVRRDAGD